MSAYKRKRTIAGAVVEDRTYTIKFSWQGKQIAMQTHQSDRVAALKIQRDILGELRAGRIPDLLAKLKTRQTLTLSSLIIDYRAARCPDRNLQPRAGDSLETESRNLESLAGFFSAMHPDHIKIVHRDQYHAFRLAAIRAADNKRGPGHRSVDIELCTLNNLLYWSARQGKIDKYTPLKGPAFQIAKNIKHCREFKPASGDELHLVGAMLFADPRTEVLGWQYFLEAYTGLRSEEATQYLRRDAQRLGDQYQPGYIDDKFLYIQRVKNGINPQIVLDDPLRPMLKEFLAAMRHWHLSRYPQSPWFTPGYGSAGDRPSEKEALTKRLHALHLEKNIRKITSHGLRAYYVTVRRGQNISDGQSAYELGQNSGPELIRTTYGDPPANWSNLTSVFTWFPQTPAIPVAWRKWQTDNVILLPAATA